MTTGWRNRRNPMTGITGDTRTDNVGAGMIGECVEEDFSRMTGYALRVGGRMSAGRHVGWRRCFTYGRYAIVAA